MVEIAAYEVDRHELVTCYRELLAAGLGTGTSGNVSSRTTGGMLITPTGIAPDKMQAEQLVAMSLEGVVAPNQLLPSSEWHMHAAIYRARPNVGALVHCHSRF